MLWLLTESSVFKDSDSDKIAPKDIPYRDTEIPGYWNIGIRAGISGYRDTGISGSGPGYRDIGILEYRHTGIQGYRDTG
jgi:hypothetical protein